MMTVDKARAAICAILAELEAAECANVETLTLDTLDVTNVGSPGVQHLMNVRIELRRAPGHNWFGGAR